MTTGTSLVTRTRKGSPSLVQETLSAPTPGPHQALVRVSHVAQNPTDGKHIFHWTGTMLSNAVQSFVANAFGDRSVLGCDFAGTVVRLGPDVSKRVDMGRLLPLLRCVVLVDADVV